MTITEKEMEEKLASSVNQQVYFQGRADMAREILHHLRQPEPPPQPPADNAATPPAT